MDYTEEDIERIGKIIREQMTDISQSHISTLGEVTFYYNTIGGRAFDPDYMAAHCEEFNLDCRHMEHFESGFEEVTLTKMHQFCQSRPEHRVLYLHPKGSFHSHHNETDLHVSQEKWRRNMLTAASSKLCVEPSDDECSVCGLLALPFPSLHFPGNFFTAKCEYVRKVLPPREFMRRQNEVVTKGLLQRYVYQQFVANLLPGCLLASWRQSVLQ